METNNTKASPVNCISPFMPVHPGSILKEELKARGISQKDFARRTGLQQTHLSALIHGSRNVTPAVASKIESGLEGIPAEMWLRLQNNYNVDIQRKNVRTSMLVSGYSFRENPASVLAEPGAVYGERMRVSLEIPASDRDLLSAIALRLWWEME